LLHHNLFVYPSPFSSFQRTITGHAIRRFVRRRSDHNAVGSVLFPLSYFLFRFFLCSIGVEGSCINLFQEVGGPNFFLRKYPGPTPNVPPFLFAT